MADLNPSTNGPSPTSSEGYDASLLPDYDTQFVSEEDLAAFAAALSAPDVAPTTDDSTNGPNSPTGSSIGLTSSLNLDASTSSATPRKGSASLGRSQSRASASQSSLFISAQNDWAPVNTRVKPLRRSANAGAGGAGNGKRRKSRVPRRSRDETREGYLYTLLAWPMLLMVILWVTGLGISYMFTRLYIFLYEHYIAWRGKRNRLRERLYGASNYKEWVDAARDMDSYLGNDEWKEKDEFAYYDSKTVRKVLEQMRKTRRRVENEERGEGKGEKGRAVEELRSLVEACVKNNFVGVENSRLYSQTYYGTKELVQEFVDEVQKAIEILAASTQLTPELKRATFKHMHTNFGRTALCLSGGASFAYYHFGVVKALLDADLLPEVITGTSGGALVAALVATRTNDELKTLLVPALAGKINACSEPFTIWIPRWWRTGARFDSIDWARRCSWFTHGSLTFREAYERSGRILNVSCVPSDPHSPTLLLNYLTSPDCVVWSAVLASAAVPGILNPVVLMTKLRDGTLAPYSFGHKWKDGSLRTDIPLKALNLHFNVNFSIVSQVNPHINLFFFSSRGSAGEPVTHRRGRGWRGGFIGSALEQYLKLDLTKWLKVVKALELLPRPLGQDWSQIWLQHFSGTITIWPRSRISDFWRILSDPDPARLAIMLFVGQQSVFPKLLFLANRLKVERTIEKGRLETRGWRRGSLETILSDSDIRGLLRYSEGTGTETGTGTDTAEDGEVTTDGEGEITGDELERAITHHELEKERMGDGEAEGGMALDDAEEEEGEEEETEK